MLLGKLKKDISFALRRGTIAQVTTHHHHHALDGFAWLRLASRLRLASARSSAEAEELLQALNRQATGRSLRTMLISFLSLLLLPRSHRSGMVRKRKHGQRPTRLPVCEG